MGGPAEQRRRLREHQGKAWRVRRCERVGAAADLGGVEWGLASPLIQVLVDVAVISAQDGVQLPVVQVEGVHQGHSVGPQLLQELLHVSRNLRGLWHRQQAGLQEQPAASQASTATTPHLPPPTPRGRQRADPGTVLTFRKSPECSAIPWRA